MNWPSFDGWCAARNVDPIALPIDRLLNLIVVAGLDWRSDPKAKEDFLDALEMAGEALEVATGPERVADGASPSWWDEDEAGAEALAVARRLGAKRS